MIHELEKALCILLRADDQMKDLDPAACDAVVGYLDYSQICTGYHAIAPIS